MKRFILAAVLMTGISPAMAQQMIGPAFNYVAPKPQTPREAAISKCFRDAPWVEPKGYYDSCIAKAKTAK